MNEIDTFFDVMHNLLSILSFQRKRITTILCRITKLREETCQRYNKKQMVKILNITAQKIKSAFVYNNLTNCKFENEQLSGNTCLSKAD